VCLHDLVPAAIPLELKQKLHVIHQSAMPLSAQRSPSKRHFDVCVVGHLREEKDSLRCAYAARDVSSESRLRVFHLGKAYDDGWAGKARKEMKINSRYHWLGEVGAWRVRQEFAKTHAMVLSSVMEGGANVISEAIIAGVPVIASKIDGNIGLLGKDYPAYYPVKDTDALRALLYKAETDQKFLLQLNEHSALRKPLFQPERELDKWKALLQSL